MIPFNDQQQQYRLLTDEINEAVLRVMKFGQYIGGEEVAMFAEELSEYLCMPHIVPVANGTDALQIALMTVGVKSGDEVIVPAFTYAATAEAVAILGAVPVFVDVDAATFNTNAELIAPAITERTRAVIPVHLFGQQAPMDDIHALCAAHNIYCIEDNAQSLGRLNTTDPSYTNERTHTPTQHSEHRIIQTTSFFPTKNLACMGDGGAIITNDKSIADRARQIAQHGQSTRYIHDMVGMNSRLDAIQAAILRIRLRHFDSFISERRTLAERYTTELQQWAHRNAVSLPQSSRSHTYNQYTLRVPSRDSLRQHLQAAGIPTMVYYPIPLHLQQAFRTTASTAVCPASERLCSEVLSLPIYPTMSTRTQDQIILSLHQWKA